jgi:hypothetical protein
VRHSAFSEAFAKFGSLCHDSELIRGTDGIAPVTKPCDDRDSGINFCPRGKKRILEDCKKGPLAGKRGIVDRAS